ncbi:hypothetical protein CLO5623_02738 [Clostridium perfringens]|nr:hypothetical protein CLO5623_02738 [Clostridium perfringens]
MSDFTYKNDLIFRINEKEVNRTLKRTNWEDYFIFT